ncbi:putative fructokinase [Nematostella vectensis]|uniref:putative fructokinase n=1 Tax=Nematostella vectensis TaxID=45351 RepID=UPI002077307F|nr:putative fructokinase [Nematostella vectensis]
MSRYIAGVELGGTSCVAAIAEISNPTTIVHHFEVSTTEYTSTLGALTEYLSAQLKEFNIESYAALGIASFGPVDLKPDSKTYGYITSTPKPGWKYVEIVGVFKRTLKEGTPIAFDTDVNAPALAEMAAALNTKTIPIPLPTVIYITVGTGVGVGVTVEGSPVHGLLHPEGGHIIVPRMQGDEYPGCCAYGHECCVEGMVDSQAIAERVNVHRHELHTIDDNNPVWKVVGYYLGALCLNITYLLSPNLIILGGGIMKRRILYTETRHWFKELLKEYLDSPQFKTDQGLASYIKEPFHGSKAGIVGALELARHKC